MNGTGIFFFLMQRTFPPPLPPFFFPMLQNETVLWTLFLPPLWYKSLFGLLVCRRFSSNLRSSCPALSVFFKTRSVEDDRQNASGWMPTIQKKEEITEGGEAHHGTGSDTRTPSMGVSERDGVCMILFVVEGPSTLDSLLRPTTLFFSLTTSLLHSP